MSEPKRPETIRERKLPKAKRIKFKLEINCDTPRKMELMSAILELCRSQRKSK